MVTDGARKTDTPTGQTRPATGSRLEGSGASRWSVRHRDRQDHVLQWLLRGSGSFGWRVLRVYGGRQDGVPDEATKGRCGEHRDGESVLCRSDAPCRHPVSRRVRDTLGPAQRRSGREIHLSYPRYRFHCHRETAVSRR